MARGGQERSGGQQETKVGAGAAALQFVDSVKLARRGDSESLAEELVTGPARGHPPIPHVRTRSLLDGLEWRLDVGPGLATAAERNLPRRHPRRPPRAHGRPSRLPRGPAMTTGFTNVLPSPTSVTP